MENPTAATKENSESIKFLVKTKNGAEIYADMINSHLATHIKSNPKLLDMLKEALLQSEPEGEKVQFERDMGRTIGSRDLVETNEADDVFYAKRPNRDRYTRFVNNREPEETNFITIDLRKMTETAYQVYTAFVGKLTPNFPSGKEDTDEGKKEFWSKHALVAKSQEFVPESVTKDCPW